MTCISTRITTGIHLKNKINKTITVIMSRPQSHVTYTKHLDIHGLIFKTSI